MGDSLNYYNLRLKIGYDINLWILLIRPNRAMSFSYLYSWSWTCRVNLPFPNLSVDQMWLRNWWFYNSNGGKSWYRLRNSPHPRSGGFHSVTWVYMHVIVLISFCPPSAGSPGDTTLSKSRPGNCCCETTRYLVLRRKGSLNAHRRSWGSEQALSPHHESYWLLTSLPI